MQGTPEPPARSGGFAAAAACAAKCSQVGRESVIFELVLDLSHRELVLCRPIHYGADALP